MSVRGLPEPGPTPSRRRALPDCRRVHVAVRTASDAELRRLQDRWRDVVYVERRNSSIGRSPDAWSEAIAPPGIRGASICWKDEAMPDPGRYADEFRERAVRLLLDHGHENGSHW